jgi:hypothetical protein
VTPRPCDSCGEPVIPAGLRVLDALPTTTGPYTRTGFARHANQIATSVRYGRAEGWSPHYCPNLTKESR